MVACKDHMRDPAGIFASSRVSSRLTGTIYMRSSFSTDEIDLGNYQCGIYEGMEPEIAMMVDFRKETSRTTGEVA